MAFHIKNEIDRALGNRKNKKDDWFPYAIVSENKNKGGNIIPYHFHGIFYKSKNCNIIDERTKTIENRIIKYLNSKGFKHAVCEIEKCETKNIVNYVCKYLTQSDNIVTSGL